MASPVKVRELQRTLWAAAKQSEGRRFHALFDRICRGDVLWEAWERVRENRGAAGVDRITLVAVEDYGVDRMLRELRRDLLSGRYRPAPARRVEIPKPRGGKRPLGIPTVRDRVAQAAAKIVLEPIFEADFLPCSYGFRPKVRLEDRFQHPRLLAAVWTTRSRTVGIPNGRIPPRGFGMSTRLAGAGDTRPARRS